MTQMKVSFSPGKSWDEAPTVKRQTLHLPPTCMMSLFDSTASYDSAVDHGSAIDRTSTVDVSAPLPSEPASLSFSESEVVTRPKRTAKPAPSALSPWLLATAYFLGRHVVFPLYFGRIDIKGREHLPRTGAVILAPTHRSRWDALMLPYIAGHHVTRRHLRFMVTADEMTGLQGWFIRRMGGFPIDTKRPAIASLRHGVDLLEQGETLVIFPEGDIYRDRAVQPIKPGLARLAIQAEAACPGLGVRIVPITIHYHRPLVPWRCRVKVRIGQPLHVADFATSGSKQSARKLTATLQNAMEHLAMQG
jgi:1-acyl-sn-glycerol-3-phosphate acyltransferase